MLSAGMLTDLASATIVRSRGLASMSPPPLRAATVNSLMMRVKIFPRLASAAPFLCLMVCHLEWPDMLKLPKNSVCLTAHLTSFQFPVSTFQHVDRLPQLGTGSRELETGRASAFSRESPTRQRAGPRGRPDSRQGSTTRGSPLARDAASVVAPTASET